MAGATVTAPSNLDDLAVTLYRDPAEAWPREEQVVGCVESQGHIDDHYESLAILARRLHDFRHELQPGQWVITGFMKHPEVAGFFEVNSVQVLATFTSVQR